MRPRAWPLRGSQSPIDSHGDPTIFHGWRTPGKKCQVYPGLHAIVDSQAQRSMCHGLQRMPDALTVGVGSAAGHDEPAGCFMPQRRSMLD